MQVKQLTKRVFHSPTLREDLQACCIKSKIEPKQVIRPVATWWNTVADMLKRALDLRKALDRLVDIDRHNSVAKTRLKRFKLKSDEWEFLHQLRPLLSVRRSENVFCRFADTYSGFSQGYGADVSFQGATSA